MTNVKFNRRINAMIEQAQQLTKDLIALKHPETKRRRKFSMLETIMNLMGKRGGHVTLPQLYGDYHKIHGTNPNEYKAAIRETLQRGRNRGLVRSPQRGEWRLVVVGEGFVML